MDLQQRIQRGFALRQLLDNPDVQAAFADIEKQITATFANAKTDEARRDVWALMNAVAEVRRRLTVVVEDGEVAQRERDAAERRIVAERGTGRP